MKLFYITKILFKNKINILHFKAKILSSKICNSYPGGQENIFGRNVLLGFYFYTTNHIIFTHRSTIKIFMNEKQNS